MHLLVLAVLLTMCTVVAGDFAARVHTPSLYFASEQRSAPRCPDAASNLERSELSEWVQRTNGVRGAFTLPRGCVTALTAGFWHLEICPGRWIRQFSLSGGRVDVENFLGLQRHWAEAVASRQYLVEYAAAPATSIPARIEASPAIPSGEDLRTALAVPSASATSSGADGSGSYNCSVTHGGFTQVSAAYRAGTYCPEQRAFRSATLHLICDPDAAHTEVGLEEPAPCTYRVYLTASYLCQMMGAAPPVQPIVGRLQTMSDGRQIFRQLEDSDMRFSL